MDLEPTMHGHAATPARPARLRRWIHAIAVVVAATASIVPAASSRSDASSSEAREERLARLLAALKARAIGPAATGGRITDVAVVSNKPAIHYIATASGGVWKTYNHGTTWKPIFDDQPFASIGAIAVAPSDPEVVWVGTGEANPRNSVSWGDGVYRSMNGGRSWEHVGLRECGHVGRIVVHPRDPDTAYVAALGKLWSPNKERGLFKTRDGGRTWETVKFINEDTGFVDIALDPASPDVLYAAAYQVRRGPTARPDPVVQTGPGGGIYKSTDGGKTWRWLTRGLPDRPLGRCGLAVSPRNPRLIYAVVQTDRTATGNHGQPARENDDPTTGGVFRSDDAGDSWTKVNDLCPRPFYYGQIRADPNHEDRIYVLGVELFASSDGGRTFRTIAENVHRDHHALWINPHDSDHLILGGDGGLSYSHDRGAHWDHVANLPIGQFYAVAIDQRRPYRIVGGLQDCGTWIGPSAAPNPDGVTNADWRQLYGGDGFHCRFDPTAPDTVYLESQWGNLRRVNIATGEIWEIQPRSGRDQPSYRFGWNAPLLVSEHDGRTLYFGGNYLFRSSNRGDRWFSISGDLTRGKPGDAAEDGHVLTALAESPLKAGVLYVGTDDGRIHASRDAGAHWTDLTDTLPNIPPDRWITWIECSRFDENLVYLALDRHRCGDDAPYLFRSHDGGRTWKRLGDGLPERAPVHVIREDRRNRDLLFAGTECGLYVSLDAGRRWRRLHAGIPSVPVHDLVIHSRDRDLVVATHGRGIYILDLIPLQELTPAMLDRDAFLCSPRPGTLAIPRGTRVLQGARHFRAENPPYGTRVLFHLRERQDKPVRVSILDAQGRTLAELPLEAREPGLHAVSWNLRTTRIVDGAPPNRWVEPGEFVARIQVGDQVLTRRFRVEAEERANTIDPILTTK